MGTGWNGVIIERGYADPDGTEPVARYRCARHCPDCGGSVCEVCGGTGTVEVGATHKVATGTGWKDQDNQQGASVFGVGNTGGKEFGKHYADADGKENVNRYLCARCCGTGCGAWWLAETPTPCPECGGAGEWACAVRRLGEDSGERISHGGGKSSFGGIFGNKQPAAQTYHSKGTAARFYPNPDFSHETSEALALGAETAQRLALGPIRKYQAKPSRAERDAGLEGMPEQVWGKDTLTAGIERKNAKRGPESKSKAPLRNPHPTLKSIALTKWLASLLLPPAIYAPRRLLVPFAGTGSEAIGALLAGWEHVTMIEQEAGYCDIAEARCRFWSGWSERAGATEPKRILKAARKAEKQAAKDEAEDNGQLALGLPK
jgi:hypothetical protein